MSRIRLYSIVLASIYFLMVGYEFVNAFDSFKAGFKEGWKSGSAPARDDGLVSKESIYLSVIPKNGVYTYPDIMTNVLTGASMKMEIEKMKVEVQYNPSEMPIMVGIYKGLRVLLSFLCLFLILVIPILFFKIMRAIIAQDKLIDRQMIDRLKRLGWVLIAYNLITYLFYIGEVQIMAANLVSPENYDIKFNLGEYTLLIVGVITLLLSEILKVSLKMKEENDLTI